MNFVLRPWQLLLLILAGWINRDQQDAIEYLLTENQVLREKLGKGRILLNDDQRRRLAVKGKVLGRKSLGKLAKIVRPDTLLRWHRELIARKWDHSDKRQYDLEALPQFSAKLRANVPLRFDIDVLIRDRRTKRPMAVLDTKYKVAERLQEADIQQVVAYATRMGVRHAFLVYPSCAGAGVEAMVGPGAEALDSKSVQVRSLVFDIGFDLEESGSQFCQILLAKLRVPS